MEHYEFSVNVALAPIPVIHTVEKVDFEAIKKLNEIKASFLTTAKDEEDFTWRAKIINLWHTQK